MATSFEAASGTALPSPFVPRVFTTTGDVAYVSARLFDKNEPGRIVDEFMVYARGAFQGRYARGSKRVGNVFTVVRDGGWSSDLALYVEPAGTVIAPQLQALNDNPYAAWSLEQGNGSQKTDRTGNARHADSYYISEPIRIASPVPGKSAWGSAGYNVQARIDVPNSKILAANAASTGFAFAFWFHWTGFAMAGYGEQWVLSWGANSSSWQPWLFNQGDSNAPSGRIRYYNDFGTSITTDLYHRRGQWDFCCVSVGLDGKLTMGLNGVYEEHTGATMAPPPAEYQFSMCGAPYGNPYNRVCNGGMFDVVYWNKPRTQAQFETQRASTGIAA